VAITSVIGTILAFRVIRPVALDQPPPIIAPSSTGISVREGPPAILDQVRVTVRASPAQAHIVVDRNVVCDNPCAAQFAKDGSRHVVHIEADGYGPHDESFDADADSSLFVTLEPKKSSARPTRVLQPPTAAAQAQPAPTTAASAPPAAAATQVVVAPAGVVPMRRISRTNPYAQ
jgi:hypothetical protein